MDEFAPEIEKKIWEELRKRWDNEEFYATSMEFKKTYVEFIGTISKLEKYVYEGGPSARYPNGFVQYKIYFSPGAEKKETNLYKKIWKNSSDGKEGGEIRQETSRYKVESCTILKPTNKPNFEVSISNFVSIPNALPKKQGDDSTKPLVLKDQQASSNKAKEETPEAQISNAQISEGLAFMKDFQDAIPSAVYILNDFGNGPISQGMLDAFKWAIQWSAWFVYSEVDSKYAEDKERIGNYWKKITVGEGTEEEKKAKESKYGIADLLKGTIYFDESEGKIVKKKEREGLYYDDVTEDILQNLNSIYQLLVKNDIYDAEEIQSWINSYVS